jgi:transcriptional regulator with XRE-family HTH domain
MGTAGERIDRWLKRNKRSRAWLAEQLNVQRPVLWRWLNNKRTPSVKYLVLIQKLTGVPTSVWAADAADRKAA